MENRRLSDIIQENILLKDYSTFKIGGPARFFCVCRNEEETKTALDFAVSNKLNIFVLGRGSNLLISDKGFDGLVLKMDNMNIEVKEIEDGYEVTTGSGTYLMKLILDLQKDGIGGLEWAAGIPGSVGGAICNNAGAHGKDMSMCVKSVKAFEMSFDPEKKYPEKYEIREIAAENCGFSYRDSVFKSSKAYLISEAVLSLAKKDKEEMRKETEENMKSRLQKQPLEYPNIGSIFKNPALSEEAAERFLQKCPGARDAFKNNIIPAGWLIDQAGLRGKKNGGAEISKKHANFIVNTGGAKAEDVAALIDFIKEQISKKFFIQLHEEIEYVGF